jgi:hypothetical protein
MQFDRESLGSSGLKRRFSLLPRSGARTHKSHNYTKVSSVPSTGET